MKSGQSGWDKFGVEEMAELMYWITGGFQASTRWGRTIGVVKWFMWHVEDVTPVLPSGVKSTDMRFREVAQQIPRPDKWDQAGWYGRVSEELHRQGNPWGVGAISTTGEVMRITLGVPGVWRTMTGEEMSSLLGGCAWTSTHDLGQMCFGTAYPEMVVADTVPSGIYDIRRRYNDDGGTGPQAA